MGCPCQKTHNEVEYGQVLLTLLQYVFDTKMQVADFGLSKQKQETYVSGITSSRGTLPWIAPEIIKSPEAVTEKVCT